MRKLKTIKETITIVSNHIKRNFGNYLILTILGYLVYQAYKMVSDTGKTSDGEPYYKEFEEPESKELTEE